MDVLHRFPREPFYEFLQTSLELPDQEGMDFLSATPLRILTNNTAFDCCSVDWLFVEGRRKGAEYQEQVIVILYVDMATQRWVPRHAQCAVSCYHALQIPFKFVFLLVTF